MKEFQEKKVLNKVCFGEKPAFGIKDAVTSISVELVDYPEESSLYSTMFQFIMGSYGNEPNKLIEYVPSDEEIEEVVEASLKGEALPLAMEIPKFTFRVNGIDRIITHQIVRSRIGVVYSQHCTGDNDIRHVNYLIPHAIAKLRKKSPAWNERIGKFLVESKEIYADLIDKENISIQDARGFILPLMETYIYMSCNYMMIRNFVARRLCANETHQMQFIAHSMRELIRIRFPLLGKYLQGTCDKIKKCVFKKNDSIFAGSVYYPCGKYPRFDNEGKEIPVDPEKFIHKEPSSSMRGIQSVAEKYKEDLAL